MLVYILFCLLLPSGASTGVCGAGRRKQSHRGSSHTQVAFTADKGTFVAQLMLKYLWYNTGFFNVAGLSFRVMECCKYSE